MTSASQEIIEEIRPDGGVVVGDDGSAGAEAAVRYALEEARRWGSALHVLRAWQITSALREPGAIRGYVPSIDELQEATLEETCRRVDHLLGRPTDVRVEVHTVYAPAAKALIAASQTADVVVVGTRGLGGFATLVLGSVADQCIRHCAGPVVVIRQRVGR
jgi:nucleotide-binding universal stress UspA family protein